MRLDKEGWIHYRVYYRKDPMENTPPYSPKGGVTVFFSPDPDGTVWVSLALCSMKDHYNKKHGRQISCNRDDRLKQRYMSADIEEIDKFVIEKWASITGNERWTLVRGKGYNLRFV